MVPGFVEEEKRRGEKRREEWELVGGGNISETNRLQRRKLEIERERSEKNRHWKEGGSVYEEG